MAFKDILLHVDASAEGAARLAVAATLARRHGARLIGLCVIDPDPRTLFLADGGGFTGAALAAMIEDMQAEATAAAAKAEAAFRETLRREDIPGEWRLATGFTPELVTLHARYADLCILGQRNPDRTGPPDGSVIIEQVLFGAGRPVLVVPYAGRFDSLGRTVLVGWNASREATRAVHDALPLLVAAATTTILAVNPRGGLDGHGALPGADIAQHLAHHGVKATARHTGAEAIGEGDVLLNVAAELGADLLVIGAYGHSRLREMVMGGVTRTLLQAMTVPVLLSH